MSLDEPVVAGILRRRLGERIIGIEVDDDLVDRLHERSAIPDRDWRHCRHGAGASEGHDRCELAAAEIDPSAVDRGLSQLRAENAR